MMGACEQGASNLVVAKRSKELPSSFHYAVGGFSSHPLRMQEVICKCGGPFTCEAWPEKSLLSAS